MSVFESSLNELPTCERFAGAINFEPQVWMHGQEVRATRTNIKPSANSESMEREMNRNEQLTLLRPEHREDGSGWEANAFSFQGVVRNREMMFAARIAE